jgi:hypothetical protein
MNHLLLLFVYMSDVLLLIRTLPPRNECLLIHSIALLLAIDRPTYPLGNERAFLSASQTDRQTESARAPTKKKKKSHSPTNHTQKKQQDHTPFGASKHATREVEQVE